MGKLVELTAKVDAFFARVQARHGADMQCGTGCSDCCHVRLSITGVEADAIRAEVATWPAARRQELAEVGPADRCAALDSHGRCRIYAARPIVCRSHGAPIRFREGTNAEVRSCHLNFKTEEADADCIFDQTTLSALVLAFDRRAGHDGTRIELAALLAALSAT